MKIYVELPVVCHYYRFFREVLYESLTSIDVEIIFTFYPSCRFSDCTMISDVEGGTVMIALPYESVKQKLLLLSPGCFGGLK